MALIDFPLKLERKNWSREERENLEKGIRQQFQERALQVSVGWLRYVFLIVILFVFVQYLNHLFCVWNHVLNWYALQLTRLIMHLVNQIKLWLVNCYNMDGRHLISHFIFPANFFWYISVVWAAYWIY